MNRIISGQETHSLEYYVDFWLALARPVTGLMATVMAVAGLWIRYNQRARTALAWALGGGAAFRTRKLLLYAATVGAVAGLTEALDLAYNRLIEKAPAARFYSEIVWMAPLSAIISFLLVASVLAGLAHAGRVNVSVSKATFILASMAIYGVLQSRGIPLHPAAEVILALGLGAALSRLAAMRAELLKARLVVWSRYVAAVVVVVTILGLFRLPSITERRALASLPQVRSGLPNILLIILDTVRSRNLSLYGYQRPTTPRLDEWAESGVVFEQAFSTAPWTLPSHASMFTGRYHFEIGSGVNQPLDARFPTLAEVLTAHGYATGGFVANLLYTTEMSGLQRGFARYEDFPVTVGMFIWSSWLSRSIGQLAGNLLGLRVGPGAKNAERVTAEFLHWLDGQGDRPFFAFLNYFDAHSPYWSPEPFRSRFGPPPASGLPMASEQFNSKVLEPFVNAYDGAISYIDWQVGVIFDTLAARGLLDQTLVIVTSDHGEMFGEHGQILHNGSLYMPEVRVPLAISFPGKVPNDLRIREPVTLRDLPATVLSLTGIASPSIPGRSLTKSWTAGCRSNDRVSPVLAEVDSLRWALPWQSVYRGNMASILADSLHYIRNGDGVEELYHFRRDPDEKQDLCADPNFRPALDRLRASLDSIVQ